ncbi:MAG: hypothetical protein IJ261_03610, partial [Clostridia bacterium]|nr:hypothetical protein [Clostridia bacterium]
LCETDSVAHDIVTNEAHRFSKTVLTLLKKVKNCSTLGLYGGIFQHSVLFKHIFEDDIKTMFPHIETQLLSIPPEESALKLARELK